MTSDSVEAQAQAAEELRQRGNQLLETGQLDQALVLYNRVIARFAQASEPELRLEVAKALVNKAILLSARGESAEAIDIYNEVVSRVGRARELDLRVQVAKALVNKGAVFQIRGDIEQAVTSCSEVVGRFGKAREPELHKLVAMALYNKGFTLAEHARSTTLRDREREAIAEKAVAAYSDVIDGFGSTPEFAVRELVAKALFGRATTLVELAGFTTKRGREKERIAEKAVAAYSEFIERFGVATEPALRQLVAWALIDKGFMLGKRANDCAFRSIVITDSGGR